jgi:hypothetical protein
MPPLKVIWANLFCSGRRVLTLQRIVLAELICLGVVLLILVSFAVKVYVEPYLPANELNDGIGYFIGAKAFYVNHNLGGVTLLGRNVSPVGEFYTHGFFYSLVNGTIALIFGWHDKLIIICNMTLLAACAALILLSRYSWPWALALLLVFLTYYIVPTMTFAYYQEIVQLLIALILSRLLFTIFDMGKTPERRIFVVCYYVIITMAAVMRPSWAFWAFGLVPVGNSKREKIVIGSLAVAYVGLGYLFHKLFYAPFPYFTAMSDLVAAVAGGDIAKALSIEGRLLSSNFRSLFDGELYVFGQTSIPYFYHLIVFLNTTYLYFLFWKRADRAALAVALVGTVYILIIFTVWQAASGVRQIAPVFVLQMVYFVERRNSIVVGAFAIMQLMMLPAVVALTGQIVDAHVRAGRYAVENPGRPEALNNLGSAVSIGRRATIFVDETLANEPYPPIVHFALRSADGHPIRYSFDLRASQPMSARRFDSTFLDFVLTPQPLSRPDLTLVYMKNNFYLYRLS